MEQVTELALQHKVDAAIREFAQVSSPTEEATLFVVDLHLMLLNLRQASSLLRKLDQTSQNVIAKNAEVLRLANFHALPREEIWEQLVLSRIEAIATLDNPSWTRLGARLYDVIYQQAVRQDNQQAVRQDNQHFFYKKLEETIVQLLRGLEKMSSSGISNRSLNMKDWVLNDNIKPLSQGARYAIVSDRLLKTFSYLDRYFVPNQGLKSLSDLAKEREFAVIVMPQIYRYWIVSLEKGFPELQPEVDQRFREVSNRLQTVNAIAKVIHERQNILILWKVLARYNINTGLLRIVFSMLCYTEIVAARSF